MADLTPSNNNSVPHETEDRRQSPRRRRHVKALISDAGGMSTPVEAWVLDRSLGGLCLAVQEEVPIGSVLGVLPKNAPPGSNYLPIEVKSCRPLDHGFELGCQFLRMPSYSFLLLFG